MPFGRPSYFVAERSAPQTVAGCRAWAFLRATLPHRAAIGQLSEHRTAPKRAAEVPAGRLVGASGVGGRGEIRTSRCRAGAAFKTTCRVCFSPLGDGRKLADLKDSDCAARRHPCGRATPQCKDGATRLPGTGSSKGASKQGPAGHDAGRRRMWRVGPHGGSFAGGGLGITEHVRISWCGGAVAGRIARADIHWPSSESDERACVGHAKPRHQGRVHGPLSRRGECLWTVSDDVRVRSDPGVGSDSRRYRPLLRGGHLPCASPPVPSPHRGSGGTKSSSRRASWTDGITRGWVAAGDHDGSAWIGYLPDTGEIPDPDEVVELPVPIVEYVGAEINDAPEGGVFVRYNFNVNNWEAFDGLAWDESSDDGPCGEGAGRILVRIIDQDGDPLNAFCGFSAPYDLMGIWFAGPIGGAARAHSSRDLGPGNEVNPRPRVRCRSSLPTAPSRVRPPRYFGAGLRLGTLVEDRR